MTNRHRCWVDYCFEPTDANIRMVADPESVIPMCSRHAAWHLEHETGVEVGTDQETGLLEQFIGERICDEPSCPFTGTHWVLWKLDEDDDDNVVGRLCKVHAQQVVNRGHGQIIELAEALEFIAGFDLTMEPERTHVVLEEWSNS